MKTVDNFHVVSIASYCPVQLFAGTEKCWVWRAADWSDGEPKHRSIALKFGSQNLAVKFRASFEYAKVLEWAVVGAGISLLRLMVFWGHLEVRLGDLRILREPVSDTGARDLTTQVMSS